MTPDPGVAPQPWWHAHAPLDEQAADHQPAGDDGVKDNSGLHATEELVRLLAALREWLATGGGARARTTLGSATRALGGTLRPEVVEHLHAAALELAAALHEVMTPPVAEGSSEKGDPDPVPTQDVGGNRESSSRRVQRIDLG